MQPAKDVSAAQTAGSAIGGVRRLLQAEGFTVLLASLFGFHYVGGNWTIFALLILSPDLVFLAYLGGPTVGAAAYNTVHSYILPVLLLCTGVFHPALLPFGLIWISHIAFDRSLGFGLKYHTGFTHTHLGNSLPAHNPS